MKSSLLFLLLAANSFTCSAQFFQQDFDDGEPDPWIDTLEVRIDSSSSLWQIGLPQKEIFDEAYSLPNAIMTDTISAYPVSDTSIFYVEAPFSEIFGSIGILAFSWVQKLDIDSLDGGTVDFSIDGGETWQNAFDSPYVYNWYGWEFPENVDTLANETIVFTGRDSTWREIWLCYEYYWLNEVADTLHVRFTFFSDTISGESDGWIIDNIRLEPTWVHTVGEGPTNDSYVNLYPNPASDRLNIELKKSDEFHIIEELKIFSETGRLIESFKSIPTKFFVDTSDLPSGVYEVFVRSNLKTEIHKIIITR